MWQYLGRVGHFSCRPFTFPSSIHFIRSVNNKAAIPTRNQLDVKQPVLLFELPSKMAMSRQREGRVCAFLSVASIVFAYASYSLLREVKRNDDLSEDEDSKKSRHLQYGTLVRMYVAVCDSFTNLYNLEARNVYQYIVIAGCVLAFGVSLYVGYFQPSRCVVRASLLPDYRISIQTLRPFGLGNLSGKSEEFKLSETRFQKHLQLDKKRRLQAPSTKYVYVAVENRYKNYLIDIENGSITDTNLMQLLAR